MLIHVPKESDDSYKSSSGWSQYKDIIVGYSDREIWYTTIDGKTITLTNDNSFGAEIIVNEYNNGKGYIKFDKTLTSIGDATFAYCDNLRTITLPNSVTSIGTSAFNGCERLQGVKISDGVISLGWGAFVSCKSLQSVTLPNSISSIGNQAFDGCSNLKNVYCYNEQPPNLAGQGVFDSNFDGRLIHVMRESASLYKNATNWSEYKDSIIGDL